MFPGMEKIIYLSCRFFIHGFYSRKFFYRGILNAFQSFEMLHQSLSSGRSDTRDIVQQGMYLAFASQRTVVLYGESVGFILDPCDQPERL